MDPERERIQADLRGLLQGEVRCDDVFVQMYSSDASIFEIRPSGVVRPKSTSEVVACMKYAYENHIPVHARGAGTGLAGESLGTGLVLDFSHSMRRIISTDSDTVRIQPGVVYERLNHHLKKSGRLFGPDPASGSVSTMGSVLAVDASGSHWLEYGSARDQVISLQVVLADGEVLEIEREPVRSSNSELPGDRRRDLVSELSGLLKQNEKLISQNQPRTLVNRCGYHLTNIFQDNQLNLAELLIGSEGTLALITEATVKTQPLPKSQGVVLLFFDRLESAAHAALEVVNMDCSACDLMDRRLLALARESDVRYDVLIPDGAEAMLLVEIHGDEDLEVRSRLSDIISTIQRQKHLAFDARTALDKDDLDLFWRLTRHVVPMLYQLKGTERPLPFVEDIAIPPEMLPEFLVTIQNILKRHQVTASLFAHAGHGQLHLRPFLDLADPNHVRKLDALAIELYDQTIKIGGTISGEHADGLSRSPFVQRQYGPLFDVFREVKRIFDPHNILNPGKVISDDPELHLKNHRPVTIAPFVSSVESLTANAEATKEESSSFQNTIPLQLNWNAEELTHTARTCNGCGRCRTQESDSRMCPIFRFSSAEEASPRAKANLVRGVLTGQLAPEELSGEALKQIADLCVNCHQCRLECPASVDIPKLMTESKGQYVATNGLRLTDYFMTRLDILSSFGSLISPLSNWAIGNRQMRWFIEKIFGIAQARKLPRFSKRSFIRGASRRRLTKPTRRTDRKVLFFVDLYSNWYDVQLANALVAVLEHNGIAVYVPPEQQQSAMAMISLGALDKAKQVADHNLSFLTDAVRQGYHVVTTEPSAALAIIREYPQLIDDDDAFLVAENTSEACSYLWKLHQTGKLELDMNPVNCTLGYHTPCHLRALDVGSPGEHLLQLVPGLTVQRIEKGCSGMAGTYGLKKENYRSSLRAGWDLISELRDPSIQAGTTECSACKIQMEQGTTKPTIHPIKILALAYGLMPEISKLLSTRAEELIVT